MAACALKLTPGRCALGELAAGTLVERRLALTVLLFSPAVLMLLLRRESLLLPLGERSRGTPSPLVAMAGAQSSATTLVSEGQGLQGLTHSKFTAPQSARSHLLSGHCSSGPCLSQAERGLKLPKLASLDLKHLKLREHKTACGLQLSKH